MKKRKNFSQLPHNEIMDKIIEEEESRIIPQSKRNISYPDYSTFKKWLSELDLNGNFIDSKDWKVMMKAGKKNSKISYRKNTGRI